MARIRMSRWLIVEERVKLIADSQIAALHAVAHALILEHRAEIGTDVTVFEPVANDEAALVLVRRDADDVPCAAQTNAQRENRLDIPREPSAMIVIVLRIGVF